MSYLYGGLDSCSCGLFGISGSDDIKLEKQNLFVDETGEEVCFPSHPYIVGKKYTYVEKWSIRKGYANIKSFNTEEEAKAELDRIAKELETKGDTIIKV